MSREPTQEIFLKDVATHRMIVQMDQGVYRHLEFRQTEGSWNHRFHIITTPWRLIVTGDMGTWVFSRLEDMFRFFRSDDGRINVDYWSEKVINGVHGGSDSYMVYDGDTYRERLIETLENYDLTEDHKALVIEELKSLDFDDKHWVISQIRDFEVYLEEEGEYVPTRELAKQPYADRRKREKFTFSDVWEIDMKVYSYHFIWCCYAIAWAIQQYDAAKAELNGREIRDDRADA